MNRKLFYFFKNKLLENSNQKRSCFTGKVKDFHEIPKISPSLPIIGTNWIYTKLGYYNIEKMHEANLDKYHRYGGIVKEDLLPGRPAIHLFDPHDFETVFLNQGKTPIRPASEFVVKYRATHPDRYPNAGLAHLQGNEWFKQRKLLLPAMLKLGSLDVYLPIMNMIANDFVEHMYKCAEIENNEKCEKSVVKRVVDVQQSTYRYALESIWYLCLDKGLQCLKDMHITEEGKILIETTKKLFKAYQSLYYGFPLWKWIETRSYRQLAESESIIYEIAGKSIEQATQDIKSGKNDSKPSLLRTLLSIPNLNEKEVRTLIIDFIAGGINTTSNMLAIILFHLANNQEVQKNLYEELKTIFPEQENFQVNADKLHKSKYLKACVKESFRLDSSIPCIVRVLQKDCILSNYLVPKDTLVFANFYTTCRLEKYFENPLQYKPERWLNEERKKIHRFSSLPFGFGARMCTGMRFSEMQLHLAIIKTILQFQILPCTRDVDIKQRFILVPSHAISIRLLTRKFFKEKKFQTFQKIE